MKLFLVLTFIIQSPVFAGPREQADRLYTSLTGIKASREKLDYMEKILSQKTDPHYQDLIFGMAKEIVDSKGVLRSEGAFYDTVVRNMVTPWSSKEGLISGDFNDLTATVVGYIRDERPFNQILYDNIVYKAKGIKITTESGFKLQGGSVTNSPCGGEYPACDCNSNSESCWCNPLKEREETGRYVRFEVALSGSLEKQKYCRQTKWTDEDFMKYATNVGEYLATDDEILEEFNIDKSNAHYKSIEKLGLDLSNPSLLRPVSQTSESLVDVESATAGLFTTRTFASAYYIAGTNRAPVAYAMKYFMCRSMEQLNDTSTPDFRNRQDVDRSPGGNSQLYESFCVGCHAGMDAQAGAFAYYDYAGTREDGGIIYSPEFGVNKKMTKNNSTFTAGFVTEDDSWMNLWNEGKNAEMGWPESSSGTGAKSLGKMYAQTEAFNSCMAQQVFQKVCYKETLNSQEKIAIEELANQFKTSNHNMKELFIKTAILCMGE